MSANSKRRDSTRKSVSSSSPKRKANPKRRASSVDLLAMRTAAELEKQVTADSTQFEDVLQAMSILEQEASEATQKRQILKLFEWFKAQYAQLSGALRASVQREQHLISTCRELKADLLLNVTKIQTNLKIHETASQNLAFFKEECERSWKAVHISEQREQEALKIIDELREKIISLEGQVMELQRQPPYSTKSDASRPTPSRMSPTRRFIEEEVSTFSEWKEMNRVWSPKKIHSSSQELYWNNSTSSLAEKSSTEFPKTPMERAMTASPMTRKKQEPRKLSQLPSVERL